MSKSKKPAAPDKKSSELTIEDLKRAQAILEKRRDELDEQIAAARKAEKRKG